MEKTNRRAFLSKASILGLGAISGAALLQACSNSQSQENASPSPSPSPAPAAASCDDHNIELSESDLSVRESVGYIAVSEKEDQICKNCRFYQADKFAGACGGCQLFVNGSVDPAAWCKSWAAS